jgi:hypothetical protein
VIRSKNIEDNIGSTATFLSGCSTIRTALPWETYNVGENIAVFPSILPLKSDQRDLIDSSLDS